MEIELPEPDGFLEHGFIGTFLSYMPTASNPQEALYTEAKVRQAIAAAVAKEREACAKLCEEMAEQTLAKQDGEIEQVDLNLRLIAIAGQKTCAEAIRARGETPCN